MNIVFRVDASIHIGSGHVMRCLTLAHALQERGGNIIFLCGDLPGHMAKLIEQLGFTCQLIPSHNRKKIERRWSDAHQEQHAQVCLQYLQAPIDWFVIDHYGFDESFERAIRPITHYIFVLDDLANRRHEADMLLDCNIRSNMTTGYQNLVPKHCKLCLGPSYALLRKEFHFWSQRIKNRQGDYRHLLLFFSGSDPDNVTTTALNAVIHLQKKRPHLSADVVIGQHNPYREQLQKLCSEKSYLRLHVQTQEMAKLMAHADLALGAGGSSHWERCRLSLPTLACTLADNQKATTQALARLGVCNDLGYGRRLTSNDWYQALSHLRAKDLENMAGAAQQIMGDSDGCRQVVETLFAYDKKGAS